MSTMKSDESCRSSEEEFNESRDSDSDEYKDAALNLLDMRDRARIELQPHQNKPNPPENISTTSISHTSHAELLNRVSSSYLAGIINPHIPTIGTGEPSKLESISITKYYEPKFLQIFTAYCENTRQQLTSAEIGKQHLMILCLNHLIPFCCWARENATRYQWIKTTLDDNVDLRPEVRNGLSMILIYAFSAAQAREKRDADMFTVLQDNDNGLGIVNKTSLKIYNDPFLYFNFLKSSISGLIDSGKIPENERINQPKKSKKMSENKEEVVAYLQIKSWLVATLNAGDNATVKAKVQQISNIWLHKTQQIRSRRFATALALFITNPNAANIITTPVIPAPVSASSILTIPTVGNPGPSAVSAANALAASTTNLLHTLNFLNGTTTNTAAITTTSADLLDTSTSAKKRSFGNMMFPEGTLTSMDTSMATEGMEADTVLPSSIQSPTTGHQNGSGMNGLLDLSNHQSHSHHMTTHPFSSSTTTTAGVTTGAAATGASLSLSALNTNTTANTNTSNTNNTNNHISYVTSQQQNNITSSTTGNTNGSAAGSASVPSLHTPTVTTTLPLSTPSSSSSTPLTTTTATSSTATALPTATTTATTIPVPTFFIPILRFERIGLKEWEYFEMQIQNTFDPTLPSHTSHTSTASHTSIASHASHASQAFFTQYPGTFCLIDETKLHDPTTTTSTSTTTISGKVNSFLASRQTTGFISLANEFTKRNALISTWGKTDIPHLITFLKYYYHQQIYHYTHQSMLATTNTMNTMNTNTAINTMNTTNNAINTMNTMNTMNSPLSLLDVWYEHAHSTNSATATSATGGTSATTTTTTTSGMSGRGMLAYEIRIQIGIVLRSNSVLGIKEDCWRFLYVQELQSYGRPPMSKRGQSSGSGGSSGGGGMDVEEEEEVCFGQYLSQFFPQLKPIFRNGNSGNGNGTSGNGTSGNSTSGNGNGTGIPIEFGNILIKYYPHHLPDTVLDTTTTTSTGGNNMSITSPPPRPDTGNTGTASGYCYQTLGTLDELTTDIFARFDHNYSLCFHDIVLESI